jgi:hypothetical protein
MRSGSLDHFGLKNPGPQPDSAPLVITAAAASELVGQHISKRNGGATSRDRNTSSIPTGSWNCDRRFLAPYARFFTDTMAICSTVVP